MGTVSINYKWSSFYKGVTEMADVGINPFGEHDKADEQPDKGETITFTPGGVTERPTWGPEREQETLFG